MATRRREVERDNTATRRVRFIATLIGLGVAAYVALSPAVVYAPTPRAVLYLLVALVPAILFAGEASAQFKMELPGFVATATGAVAVVLILLMVLTHISKPEQQIGVFEIVDESNQPIAGLDRAGSVQIPRTANGLTLTPLVDGNSVVLIFPEQAPVVDILVKPVLTGPVYRGKVSYAGSRTSRLVLGRDLTLKGN